MPNFRIYCKRRGFASNDFITEEDAKKEGCSSVAEFKKVWEEIYGKWNPEQEVYVVEFKLLDKTFLEKEKTRAKKYVNYHRSKTDGFSRFTRLYG